MPEKSTAPGFVGVTKLDLEAGSEVWTSHSEYRFGAFAGVIGSAAWDPAAVVNQTNTASCYPVAPFVKLVSPFVRPGDSVVVFKEFELC